MHLPLVSSKHVEALLLVLHLYVLHTNKVTRSLKSDLLREAGSFLLLCLGLVASVKGFRTGFLAPRMAPSLTL